MKITYIEVMCFVMISTAIGFAGDIHVALGPVYRSGMKFEATGSSYSQMQNLQGARARRDDPATMAPVDSSDNLTQFADRDFDDGFVNISRGTETFLGGRTWYWGYEDSSQYDAGNDTLTFQKRYGSISRESYTHVRVDTVRDEEMNMEDHLSGWGVQAGAEMVVSTGERTMLSMCARVAVIPGVDFTGESSTYEQEITEFRGIVEQGSTEAWDYTYDTTGVIPPAAPYNGSTFDGPGPTIPNLPANRTLTDSQNSAGSYETSRDVYAAYNRINLDVDMDLYSLQAGPRMAVQVAERVDLSLAGLVSLHLADVDATRKEEWILDRNGIKTVQQSWRDHEEDQFLRVGVGAEAGVNVKVAERGFIRLNGGGDIVPESVDMNVGPSDVSLDLSAWSAGAEVGWNW